MPRVSPQALEMAPLLKNALAEANHRPAPPPDLDEWAVAEWSRVVDALPAAWFGRDLHGLLGDYCRHQSYIAKISQVIRELEEEMFSPQATVMDRRLAVLGPYNDMLKIIEREGRCLLAFATKLGITKNPSIGKLRKQTSDPTDDTAAPWG
jgi:phage terminase small subunit